MVEQLEHVVTHLGPYAKEPLELASRSAVDCDQMIVEVDDLDERIGPLDDVCQHLALSERLGDSRLECFVELLKCRFGPFARRDVLEQHRDLAVARRLNPKGSKLEMASGRD